MFRTRNACDVGCLECVFGIWVVQNVGNLRYEMFWMFRLWHVCDVDVSNVGCLECGMFCMWNVRDVRFLVCGAFGT